MISGEVRKDRWSVFTDLIYLDFANEKSSVKAVDFGGSLVSSSLNIATSSSFRGTEWTLGVGYAVQTGEATMLDVFGGLRYFELSGFDKLATGGCDHRTGRRANVSADRRDLPEGGPVRDGIVGVRGRIPLGSSHWSIPYYLDLGTGSSSWTWQGMLGVDYSFKWGGVILAYRNLYYDQKDDKLLQDLRFTGPALGVTFRF